MNSCRLLVCSFDFFPPTTRLKQAILSVRPFSSAEVRQSLNTKYAIIQIQTEGGEKDQSAVGRSVNNHNRPSAAEDTNCGPK